MTPVAPAVEAEVVRRLEAIGIRKDEVDEETWALYADDMGEKLYEESLSAAEGASSN